MKTSRLPAVLALLAISILLFAVPASAQGEEEVTDAVVTQEEVPEEQEAAVVIEEQPEAETQADWTYRFMIPTTLALGAVVIVVTAGAYFARVVRKRYRIVEE